MYRPFPDFDLDTHIVSTGLSTDFFREFILNPVQLYEGLSGLRTIPHVLLYVSFFIPYYIFVSFMSTLVMIVNIGMAMLSIAASIIEYCIDILAYFVVNRRFIFGDRFIDVIKNLTYTFLLKRK